MRFRRIPRRGFVTRLAVIALAIALLADPVMSGLGQINLFDPLSHFETTDPPALPPERLAHILHGDARGGGHLHGTGKPCKSEFPASWNPQKIENVILETAANDNLAWKRESNGYETANVRVEDISLRLVVDPEKNEIITAYPTNVPRNPCPAPANDNRE